MMQNNYKEDKERQNHHRDMQDYRKGMHNQNNGC